MRASKKDQKEEMKSTAYSFTLISVVGALLLILFATGVLPVPVASYMKVMITVVMGIMLFIFFIVGIRAFVDLKKLSQEAIQEEQSISHITEWFSASYRPEDIDSSLDVSQPREALYYGRYEIMSQLIRSQYPSIEEEFLDNMIESLYSVFFPENDE